MIRHCRFMQVCKREGNQIHWEYFLIFKSVGMLWFNICLNYRTRLSVTQNESGANMIFDLSASNLLFPWRHLFFEIVCPIMSADNSYSVACEQFAVIIYYLKADLCWFKFIGCTGPRVSVSWLDEHSFWVVFQGTHTNSLATSMLQKPFNIHGFCKHLSQ